MFLHRATIGFLTLLASLASASFFYVTPVSAATCPYDSTQATCACAVTGPGVTCYNGDLFKTSGTTCVSDPRLVPIGSRGLPAPDNHYYLSCPTDVNWTCDTATYPCSNCSDPTSTQGASCSGNGTCPNPGVAPSPPPTAVGGIYTNRCSATGCSAGQTLCSSPAPGYCVPNRTCPAGTTWNVCTDKCTTPYVLLSPPATVDQVGFVRLDDGNIYLNGPTPGNGNLVMNDGKAIQADKNGASALYMGNWGGAGGAAMPFDLNLISKNSSGQTTIAFGDAACSTNMVGIGIGGFSSCNVYTLLGGDGNTYINRENGKNIIFQMAGTGGSPTPATQMVLNNFGSLGVGTNAPLSSLHVKGSQTWGTDFSLDANQNAGHRWLMISTAAAAAEGNGKLIIKDQDAAGGPAVRLTIDDQGKVGLGTTAPSSALDINGALTLLGQAVTPPCPPDNTGRFYYDSSSDVFKFSTGKPAGTCTPWGTFVYITGVGTTDQVVKFAGPGSLANSQITDNGTNVGIATTSPGARLQVIGADALNTTSAFRASGSAGVGLSVTDANHVGVGTATPAATFAVGNTEQFQVDGASGNVVSTGTITTGWPTPPTVTAPNQNLIYGNMTDPSRGDLLELDRGTVPKFVVDYDGTLVTGRVNWSAIGNYAQCTAPDEYVKGWSTVDGTPICVKIPPVAANRALTNLCSGSPADMADPLCSITGGYTGISTSVFPAAPLAPDFGSAAKPFGSIYLNNTLNSRFGVFSDLLTAQNGILASRPSGLQAIRVLPGAGVEGVRIVANGASALAVRDAADANTIMAVTQTGSLGVGTGTPAEFAEIRDDSAGVTRLRITETGAGQNPELQLHYGAGADNHWSLYVNNGATKDLRIWGPSGGSDRLTITQAGAVGLGTTAPGFPLDIRDASGAAGTAIMRLNQDNVTSAWTGTRLDRQGHERWFVGMNNSNDNLVIRRDGGFDDVTISHTTGRVTVNTLQVASGAVPNYVLVAANASGDAVWQSMGAVSCGNEVFVGLTPATYNGNVGSTCGASTCSGYVKADYICSQTYPGSHVCSVEEIDRSARCASAAFLAIPDATNFWLNGGPPGYTALANDCQGWTDASGSTLGRKWKTLSTSGGSGLLTVCSQSLQFGCCR